MSCSMLTALLYIGCNSANTNPFCLQFVLLESVNLGYSKHQLRWKNCTEYFAIEKGVIVFYKVFFLN